MTGSVKKRKEDGGKEGGGADIARTWYCWYSETRSFMLLSASVNSISSMPSPVYLERKGTRKVKCRNGFSPKKEEKKKR